MDKDVNQMEAVINAFYYIGSMSYKPISIEIEPDCINIMNFPSSDWLISEKIIAEEKRFISRCYHIR